MITFRVRQSAKLFITARPEYCLRGIRSMSDPKTKKNNASVEGFLQSVENEKRRADSFVVLDLMKEVTSKEPTMWGSSIVGFGSYHYKYASGRRART